MARSAVNGGDDLSGDQSGIPSGLNRIKILHASYGLNNSMRHDSVKFPDSGGGCLPPAAEKKKEKERRRKTSDNREGFYRGRKIAHWLTSYLMKDNRAAKNIHPNTEGNDPGAKMLDKDECWETKNSTEKELSEIPQTRKVPSGFKSFSHELGPKGGIRTAPPRAHSYNDLKEILGSLYSRFDAAKVVVNTELSQFAKDVREFLEKEHTSPEGQKSAEDLLILAQLCTEMSSAELRAKCGGIVQNLADNRHQCQAGLAKQLFTRMLFILTRCTRLLQFEKDHEPIDENSLHKFKQCWESVPAIEMSWLQPTTADYSAKSKSRMKHQLSGKDVAFSLSDRTGCWYKELSGDSAKVLRNDSIALVPELLSQNPQIDAQPNKVHLTKFDFDSYSASQTSALSTYQKDNIKQCHQVTDGFHGNFLHKPSCDLSHEQEKIFDDNDSVICRICENSVPTSHLEPHSYVCAYADNCDLKYLDIDERLLKLAEILDQIIESCTLSNHASHAIPEVSRLQNGTSVVVCEGQSPKIVEWHNKGVEGMFEDLHEMDTACIDESIVGNFNNLKGHGVIKCNHYGPPSSTGSMASISSTNTPRASHFDLFWLEQNNTYGSEDVQQMINLAELACYIASTDLTKEGAPELLLTHMYGLQDILQQSKVKALVIDTFGSRVENLLREKYLLACEQMDGKSPDSARKFKGGCLVDNDSQSSAISTPSYTTHKDRTSIEDFEIIKPISRGAYGKVFLARKRTTGDIFAIKVLKKLDLIQKNDIDRILAERNILITVRNPFVVRFFYSFTCRDNLYLVMEYLNGGDLFSLLRVVGCLEEDVARAYIAELVLALEYLHSLGIVHRDLKPDNILIAHDGHIKLTDFGLSKIGLINSTVDLSGSDAKDTTLAVVDDIHTSFEHTQQMDERSAVGTPDYLAPEILLGTEHGYAADWWSVGIILFEFITGVPPFGAESPEMIFDNILSKEIPWPIIPTEMSYEAQDLINRLLVHDPDQRLGANGASEVKAHPFFKGVNWDTLTSQKAAFVPNPDSADDTSYFMSRYSQISNGTIEDQNSSGSESYTTDCCSNSELEKDEFGDLADFNSSPLDLSLLNFSFKNLSQLAAINYDVLLQRDSSNSSSPSRGTSH